MGDVPTIDLNADLGEGAGFDDQLLRLVTSANVACGAHAGSRTLAAATARSAAARGVIVGAHPGHPDRTHFGRRALPITPQALDALLSEQLAVLADAGPIAPRYLKLHGALYHQAAADPELAHATVAAARRAGVMLLAPPGSVLLTRARALGVRAATEGFVDRAYTLVDGRPQLLGRDVPGGVLAPRAAVAQAVQIATTATVNTADGATIPLDVESLCVHGDSPGAAAIAAEVRGALERAGVQLRAFAA